MTYSREFREAAYEQVRLGWKPEDVSRELSISLTTLYTWLRSDPTSGWVTQRLSREGVCGIEGCSKPIVAKRLCEMHRWRVNEYGTPDNPNENLERRFCRKLIWGDGHILWNGGTIESSGLIYGICGPILPDERAAHRVSYRLFVGDIPEGYHVDHLCSVTLCVWPLHLEAVPPGENARRTVERGRAWWQKPGKELVAAKIQETKWQKKFDSMLWAFTLTEKL